MYVYILYILRFPSIARWKWGIDVFSSFKPHFNDCCKITQTSPLNTIKLDGITSKIKWARHVLHCISNFEEGVSYEKLLDTASSSFICCLKSALISANIGFRTL